MFTPHQRKQLKKAIEKMNPTTERVKSIRNHYDILATRHLSIAALTLTTGFMFLGLYIASLTTSWFSEVWGREDAFCIAGITMLALSLPLLWWARSNINAKRRVK